MSTEFIEKITVVIVTYNSVAVIEHCLSTLQTFKHIHIVDNASEDGTVDVVERLVPQAVVHQNQKNIGYGNAVNRAMRDITTDYALVVNPDAIAALADIGRLFEAAEKYDNSAVVVPLLFDSQNQLKLPIMGPGELSHGQIEAPPWGDFSTWFVDGAVVLRRMSAWQSVGPYDPAFFLYDEDTDLSVRTTRAGYCMVVVNDAKVMHMGGQSSVPSARTKWLITWNLTWSPLYMMKKYGNYKSARRLAVSHVLKSGPKALCYWLIFRLERARHHSARLSAAITFLRGRSSVPGIRI